MAGFGVAHRAPDGFRHGPLRELLEDALRRFRPAWSARGEGEDGVAVEDCMRRADRRGDPVEAGQGQQVGPLLAQLGVRGDDAEHGVRARERRRGLLLEGRQERLALLVENHAEHVHSDQGADHRVALHGGGRAQPALEAVRTDPRAGAGADVALRHVGPGVAARRVPLAGALDGALRGALIGGAVGAVVGGIAWAMKRGQK